MYKHSISTLRVLPFVLLLFLSTFAFAQKKSTHNNAVAFPPNADQNVEVLNSYMDALIAGNMTAARSYLAPGYVEYGPSASDSLTLNQVLESWGMVNNQRTEQALVGRRTLSVRVKSGADAGDWVMGWGTYHWKERSDGTELDLLYQVTAKIADGKLQMAMLLYDRAGVRDKMGYVTIPPNVDPDAYMIRQVIENETMAWLKNDGKKMGSFWADLPYAAHTVTDELGKAYDITASEIGELVARLSTQKPNKPGTTFVNSKYNIRPNGNAAWATFEQSFLFPDGTKTMNMESRYLEKIDGQWKIIHMTSIPKR